jgi:uncharacterized iron-regulated membrane protein
MSAGETVFLVGVISVFIVFSGVLMWAEKRTVPKN